MWSILDSSYATQYKLNQENVCRDQILGKNLHSFDSARLCSTSVVILQHTVETSISCLAKNFHFFPTTFLAKMHWIGKEEKKEKRTEDRTGQKRE